VIHRGRGVNLYEPNFQILVYHEIIAQELEAILAIIYHILDTFKTTSDMLTHLRPNGFLKNISPIKFL
jgi:hypothetical protein